jgi:hypothetical protein
MATLTEVKAKDIDKLISDNFFSELEYALMKGVCPRTLQRDAIRGTGVPPTIIRKKRYYEKKAVFELERREKAGR